MKTGKRYRNAATTAKVEEGKVQNLPDAIERLKATATAKFDETIEVAMRLGVDPRHAEQLVRGSIVLPHGTGKKVRVLVLTKGDKEREAREAGADHVGSDEWIKKLNEGWLDPRGLMPNPRSGTVTFDVAKAVRDVKGGKIEYRVDKAGNLHAPVGKASFGKEQLLANVETLLREVVRTRPPAAKGQYIRSVTLSSTMGPPVRLDPATVQAAFKA